MRVLVELELLVLLSCLVVCVLNGRHLLFGELLVVLVCVVLLLLVLLVLLLLVVAVVADDLRGH